MKKGKIILRVQPIATIGTWLILLAIFILFIFMPSWGNFEKSELDSKIIFYSILVIICLLCFISFIYQLQYAIVSEDGIIIKNLFFTFISIKWREIYEISQENLFIFDRGTKKYCWLIFRLNQKDQIKKVGKNIRNEAPWQIIGTKRNIEIIEKYHEIKKIK